MIKVKRTVQLRRGRHSRPKNQAAQESPRGRIPRVSRLMALAIKFDGLINDGIITDQSELARLAHITQPRMTQIMNLLHLAPDIQEELLFLPRVTKGKDPIHEKMLRPITTLPCWKHQRIAWDEIRVRSASQVCDLARNGTRSL